MRQVREHADLGGDAGLAMPTLTTDIPNGYIAGMGRVRPAIGSVTKQTSY